MNDLKEDKVLPKMINMFIMQDDEKPIIKDDKKDDIHEIKLEKLKAITTWFQSKNYYKRLAAVHDGRLRTCSG
jgi:hypothetical protein